MESALFIGSWVISGVAIVAKFGYSKIKYKRMKKNIYQIIIKAKENLDEDLLIKGIELLKNLDKSNKNLLSGDMKKGLIQYISCKQVIAKMDKLERLFGLYGTGFAQPNKNGEWDKTKSNGKTIDPKKSRKVFQI